MCFNSSEDFGREPAPEGSVPIPSAKPLNSNVSIEDTGGSILDSIWNSTKGVFETVASLELQKYTAEKLADIQEIQNQGKQEQAQTYSGANLPSFDQNEQIVAITSVLSIGMLATAAYLIATR